MTDSSRPLDPESESVPEPLAPDYDERGVPSLDHVRDRIESRHATALGAAELAERPARSLEEQQAEREKAAKAKLDEIRRSLRG